MSRLQANGTLENKGMGWKGLWGLLKDTALGWSGGYTFTLGAALAFYGAFALAPTLLIAIALAGILYGDEAAKGQLDATLVDALGPALARAIADTLTYVHVSRSGWTATFVGFGLVVFAATGLFTQLQLALNSIWGVQPRPGLGFWYLLRGRFLAFMLVLGIGALLVLSIIANTVILALHARLSQDDRAAALPLWQGADWLLSLILLTLLITMMYKLLPDAIVDWRYVWVGAFITALLFALGNYLICQYLYRAAPASVYGPAGSLVVVMLWVYYSSQILLFGAEFTKHFAKRYGKPIQPAEYAVCRPW